MLLIVSVTFISFRRYTREFGSDHLYNIDPWNEMMPSESTLSYLSKASSAIMSSLRSHDPKAIWVLQGWMFAHDPSFWTKERANAFLTAVPKGEMIVLDLAAEYEAMYSKLDSFFGQPFIFCMINNYGGRMGLYGHMYNVNQDVFIARQYPNSTIIGTGLTMEGTGTNYIVYELMNEMHYMKKPVDLQLWVKNYTIRRYGISDVNIWQTWRMLLPTAYNSFAEGQELIIRRPTWKMRSTAFPAYNISTLVKSIEYLNKALLVPSIAESRSLLLQHDVVDLWREMLYVLLCKTYHSLLIDVQGSLIGPFRAHGAQFLGLFDDLNTLLLSHHSYLLGSWINSAQRLATSLSDETLFRFNALNQLTLWGPNGEISDYAGKQWADLLKHYYKRRWSLFLTYNEQALIQSVKFDQKVFEADLFSHVEQPFGVTQQNFTTRPTGNALNLAKDLYNKYKRLLDS